MSLILSSKRHCLPMIFQRDLEFFGVIIFLDFMQFGHCPHMSLCRFIIFKFIYTCVKHNCLYTCHRVPIFSLHLNRVPIFSPVHLCISGIQICPFLVVFHAHSLSTPYTIFTSHSPFERFMLTFHYVLILYFCYP